MTTTGSGDARTGARSRPAPLQPDTAEELYENAPCGYLSCYPDGRIARVNQTFLSWTGYTRDELVGRRRFIDVLTGGGRIYHETHYAPLLRMQGTVRAIALDIVRRDGSQLAVLVNSQLRTDDEGRPLAIRTTLFDASDRRRYEQELLAARRRAERATSWLLEIEHVVAALAAAASVAEAAQVVAAAGREVFGAAASRVWLGERADGRWRWADGPERPPASALPGEDALRAGDVLTRDGVPDVTAVRAALGDQPGELLVAPLLGVEHPVGVLALLVPTEQVPGIEGTSLLRTLGHQAGQALDRARLSDEDRSVATTLQQSMLPGALPADPRLGISACYRPAVDRLQVGGDWFDAFALDGDRVGVVVGDVVGRGLHAAAAMGQLRSAVRALARVDSGPGVLLQRLDGFVEDVPAAAMATLVYAEVDLRDGSVRFACAGHPPPVLVLPGGTATPLWSGRSTPLGTPSDGSPRPEATATLPAGSRLALYSDGLVERRDTALDIRIDDLTDVLAARSGRPMPGLADDVADVMTDGHGTGDDVCLLLIGYPADPVAAGTAPATHSQVADLPA